jgi:hypothetical protein
MLLMKLRPSIAIGLKVSRQDPLTLFLFRLGLLTAALALFPGAFMAMQDALLAFAGLREARVQGALCAQPAAAGAKGASGHGHGRPALGVRPGERR